MSFGRFGETNFFAHTNKANPQKCHKRNNKAPRLVQQTMAPRRPPTAWEIAKPVLEKAHLAGDVTDEMTRGQVHKANRVFEKVPINNFGNNWLCMKRTIGTMKSHATRDKLALQHDRALYPIDFTNRWDGSEAQSYLKQDIDNDIHKNFKPKELWATRNAYKAFDLDVFRPHIHQETRSKLETNYWIVKKLMKQKKKEQDLAEATDDTDFFDYTKSD